MSLNHLAPYMVTCIAMMELFLQLLIKIGLTMSSVSFQPSFIS